MTTAAITAKSLRLPRVSKTSASLVLVLVMGGMAAGCSKAGEETPPNQSQSSSGAVASGNDESREVMAKRKEISTPIAEASGAYSVPNDKTYAVTLEIFEIRRTPDFTVLSYKVSNSADDSLDIFAKRWARQPTITPKGADQSQQAISIARKGVDDSTLGGSNPCLCSGYAGTLKNVGYQEALYGPIPQDATGVEIQLGPKLKVNVPLK